MTADERLKLLIGEAVIKIAILEARAEEQDQEIADLVARLAAAESAKGPVGDDGA